MKENKPDWGKVLRWTRLLEPDFVWHTVQGALLGQHKTKYGGRTFCEKGERQQRNWHFLWKRAVSEI